ncbi:ADP-ribose glycohydrolase MACROD2 isoform X3 [Astyanax mexicanus]|uniref:ADP-ribose glycohydrolase MACROD2 isoform X3 n=1 Tax=Astyanax mexicanus TaxID=7994 RepID=UPI0020CB560C|nr:ADP-ribose glycohydrolase MACROD2 isoform X3 [Astyanax mexicanus]
MSRKKKEWRAEKERLLSLGKEDRRKECSNYLALEKIPTWRHHGSSSAEEEEDDRPVSPRPAHLCDKVSLYKGDITLLEVDAIVNAANSSLLGGGGVDGCIHRAAGHFLYEECHSLHGCDTGKAKITCGYDLPAKFVIHTVGPIARGNVGPSQNEELRSCYENSLKLVKENNLRSVAFPCISTGIYGFPNDPAADIALQTTKDWLKENKDEIDRVIFCVFLETDYEIYKRKMAVIFPADDAETDASGDVNMESQVEGDDDMDTGGTQVQKPENDPPPPPPAETQEDENDTAEEVVKDEKPAEEPKTKEEEEKKQEQKMEEKMGGLDNAAADSGKETTPDDPAETPAGPGEDQPKGTENNENDSQGDAVAMDMEGEDGDQSATAPDNKNEECKPTVVEVKQQTADSSQSKDGPEDKPELKKD